MTDIEGTDDDAVFAEERYFYANTFVLPGYRLPVPPGRYGVTLYFTETFFSNAGQRVFSVALEGRQVLPDYDTFARAGFARLDTQRFEVDVADGCLDIELAAKVENPHLNAIEVERLR